MKLISMIAYQYTPVRDRQGIIEKLAIFINNIRRHRAELASNASVTGHSRQAMTQLLAQLQNEIQVC